MKQQGFTLIELTIVCFIIIIASTAVIDNASRFIERTRARTDVLQLFIMVQTTREQAVNETTTSVLCPSKDQKNCINNWKLPIILFHDDNNNRKRDSYEQIINKFPPFIGENIKISYPKTQIRFNENGMANFYNGTLSYCLNSNIKGIIISRVGRIRFAQDLNGDHVPDVDLNTPVSCN